MRAKKLLILGASQICLGCIQAAKEMGCVVLAADMNPDAPGFLSADIALHTDITDISGILKGAQENEIDGIVAVNDFGVPTAAAVAAELGLPGISPEVASIAVDKFLMRECWERHGVPSIPYARVRNAQELGEEASRIGYPVIVKPCNSMGGGSRGVRQVSCPEELDEAFGFADSFYNSGEILVEKFVEGLEHSVEVIVRNGISHIIAISDKIKSPLPYRVDDTVLYPTLEAGQQLKDLQAAVASAVSAVGIIDGMAHVELSTTSDGPVLFELGARCGGGAPAPLVPYLTGVEEFKEAARIALGEDPVDLAPRYMRGCVMKFIYPRPGTVHSVEVINEMDRVEGVLAFHLFVGPGDEVRPLKVCGDRAGMVIAGAETRQQAHALVNRVVDNVIIKTKKQ